MGPITLFDKSFLQSLSLDESIWFDKFFYPVICPIFYVETLANLAKEQTKLAPDNAVQIIAEKTPEMSGYPCLFHQGMATHNLLGHEIPMDGRVPMPGGRHVKVGNQTGVIYDKSPEKEAFSRWQDKKFFEVERLFAAHWRRVLQNMNLNEVAVRFRNLGVDGKYCRSLEQAKELAQEIIDDSNDPYERLKLAVQFFGIPKHHHDNLFWRWRYLGKPALSKFAPYAAYVLTVELFFHIAIASNLISAERPSNRTDIAYLFYLPFCMMFVSNDRLHLRTAQLFLRPDQEFVWGQKLKSDLKRLNEHFLTYSEEERNQGIMSIATHPPIEGGYLTTELWHKWMSPTAFSERDDQGEMDPEMSRQLLDRLKEFTKGETMSPSEISKIDSEPAVMSIRHYVQRRKGSWYLVPKDMPDPDYE